MGGQYVTPASTVMIVRWLLCETVNWSTLSGLHIWFFIMIVTLFCLPWVSLVVLVWLGTALRGGVNNVCRFLFALLAVRELCHSGFVSFGTGYYTEQI